MFKRRARSPKTHLGIALAVSIAIIAGKSESRAGVASQVGQQGRQGTQAQIGVCEREAVKIVKEAAARIGGPVRAPKKTRDVAPVYPELPTGTIGTGMWVGETLVDSTGKVSRVWPIREVTLTPAFPAFNAAIVASIQQWEFEPLILGGKATPFCMTVTTSINWK